MLCRCCFTNPAWLDIVNHLLFSFNSIYSFLFFLYIWYFCFSLLLFAPFIRLRKMHCSVWIQVKLTHGNGSLIEALKRWFSQPIDRTLFCSTNTKYECVPFSSSHIYSLSHQEFFKTITSAHTQYWLWPQILCFSHERTKLKPQTEILGGRHCVLHSNDVERQIKSPQRREFVPKYIKSYLQPQQDEEEKKL